MEVFGGRAGGEEVGQLDILVRGQEEVAMGPQQPVCCREVAQSTAVGAEDHSRPGPEEETPADEGPFEPKARGLQGPGSGQLR